MESVAAFIVDKRKAFYLIYACIAVFCVFSMGWVKINGDLKLYLPSETETRRGLAVMEDEFTTFGTSNIMIDNISFAQADTLAEQVRAVDGVKSVEFDNTKDHYVSASALFSVTYLYEVSDERDLTALNEIKGLFVNNDVYYTGEVGDTTSQTIIDEMKVVLLISVIIIILVLLLTSHTYMEIPVLLITFGASALMNMGTNFLFGTISYVSNSIAVVLQLALAIDYAIILCHRYTEERQLAEPREAAIKALSKAIPEISGSSLTTLSGLAALCFMRFRIGYDMGIVLIKAILLSLFSVFTLMPGLLITCSRLIDRSHHRNFVPKINYLGKFVVHTRYILPPMIIITIAASCVFSNGVQYVFGYSTLNTIKQNESQIAEQKIDETFGSTNTLAILVPSGDYDAEAALLNKLSTLPEIKSITGLANIEAMSGYTLTDKLTPRQFSELIDIDNDDAQLLYSAYSIENGSYGDIVSGISSTCVPLIDMLTFLHKQIQEGYLQLDEEKEAEFDEAYDDMEYARVQLEGENYSRFVAELALPEESEETFAFLDTLHSEISDYYDDAILVGNSTSDYDQSKYFSSDNKLISVLSVVMVMIVLLFTFQSAGIPVLLILVIQGSIWVNFSIPYLKSETLYFMSYLVVSSIQMGANIDYAIVITNRYTTLKRTMPLGKAIVATLNQSFPTIMTSGAILVSSGFLIGLLSSNPTIASIGMFLGQGTLISIILVMVLLPQLLLLGDIIIDRTGFKFRNHSVIQSHYGNMRVNGHIRGYISGIVDADFRGVIYGTLNASVEAGKVLDLDPSPLPEASGDDGKEAAEDEKAP
jgi:predicted RND superfamily exporter protein